MQRPKEESQKIRVFLNEKEIETFRGMKVKHILSCETIKAVKRGEIILTDGEGNERGLEGSLTEGEYIKTKTMGKTT
jgi:hypothetical protein